MGGGMPAAGTSGSGAERAGVEPPRRRTRGVLGGVECVGTGQDFTQLTPGRETEKLET
jgi:hypothetical protein